MQKPTEMITSRQNPLVTLTVKLADRKHREREGLFRFDGKKLFLEALAADIPLYAVLLSASTAEAILHAAAAYKLADGCRLVTLPDDLFCRISEERAPEGVIVLAHALAGLHRTLDVTEWSKQAPARNAARVLFLESVRDPGNLGTIIRSARAFGTDLLVLSADCADIYNPRVLRAAMGTLFKQPIVRTPDLAAVIRAYRETGRVFAATLDENAVTLGTNPFMAGDAVVVGNEGHGLSPEVIEAATGSIFIPMAEGVESLNAGVAASVLLWELWRSTGGAT